MTFTLPGFSTVKRDGLELPANFTATVNADLNVGSLEETITVSGASPIVDVQTREKGSRARRENARRDSDRHGPPRPTDS